jgi:hypothetical protein
MLDTRNQERALHSTSFSAETFEKRQFLFKFKEGENFNHRYTMGISRIKI